MDQEYPRTIVKQVFGFKGKIVIDYIFVPDLMSVRYYIPSLKLEPNLEIVVLEDYDSLEVKFKEKRETV